MVLVTASRTMVAALDFTPLMLLLKIWTQNPGEAVAGWNELHVRSKWLWATQDVGCKWHYKAWLGYFTGLVCPTPRLYEALADCWLWPSSLEDCPQQARATSPKKLCTSVLLRQPIASGYKWYERLTSLPQSGTTQGQFTLQRSSTPP